MQEGLGFVCFDGQRAHMTREQKGLATENATMFLVVAPAFPGANSVVGMYMRRTGPAIASNR